MNRIIAIMNPMMSLAKIVGSFFSSIISTLLTMDDIIIFRTLNAVKLDKTRYKINPIIAVLNFKVY